MLKAKWLRDSSPGPTYTHFRVDAMHLTRAVFAPSMWQETEFPAAPGGYATMDTSHILLRGRMLEDNFGLPMREPGWISDLDAYPLPAGVHRRVAIDEVELWCCRSILDDVSVDHVDGMRLEAGQELDLPRGAKLMLIAGRLQAADQTIVAPRFVHLKSSGHLVTAIDDSHAFVWKT